MVIACDIALSTTTCSLRQAHLPGKVKFPSCQFGHASVLPWGLNVVVSQVQPSPYIGATLLSSFVVACAAFQLIAPCLSSKRCVSAHTAAGIVIVSLPELRRAQVVTGARRPLRQAFRDSALFFRPRRVTHFPRCHPPTTAKRRAACYMTRTADLGCRPSPVRTLAYRESDVSKSSTSSF